MDESFHVIYSVPQDLTPLPNQPVSQSVGQIFQPRSVQALTELFEIPFVRSELRDADRQCKLFTALRVADLSCSSCILETFWQIWPSERCIHVKYRRSVCLACTSCYIPGSPWCSFMFDRFSFSPLFALWNLNPITAYLICTSWKKYYRYLHEIQQRSIIAQLWDFIVLWFPHWLQKQRHSLSYS